MAFWSSGFLIMIAAGFAFAGFCLLQKAAKNNRSESEAFVCRRNGVSCICLAILLVIVGIFINLPL